MDGSYIAPHTLLWECRHATVAKTAYVPMTALWCQLPVGVITSAWQRTASRFASSTTHTHAHTQVFIISRLSTQYPYNHENARFRSSNLNVCCK